MQKNHKLNLVLSKQAFDLDKIVLFNYSRKLFYAIFSNFTIDILNIEDIIFVNYIFVTTNNSIAGVYLAIYPKHELQYVPVTGTYFSSKNIKRDKYL